MSSSATFPEPPAPSHVVRRAREIDAEMFFEHLVRHMSESGRDGDLHFQPSIDSGTWVKEEKVDHFTKAWRVPWNQVGWATSQPGLDWMDLRVFANNSPARALYNSMGFRELGTVPDNFRVGAQSIDDVRMALDLGKLRMARES